jgi:hypothetical protein
MTEKQKAARLANLERGRKKRMESIKQKKVDDKEPKQVEYDLSSNGSSSSDSDESDNDFIISKKPKVEKAQFLKTPTKHKKQKPVKDPDFDLMRSDVDELKNMIFDLASLQKKQNKRSTQKRESRSGGGTKIVVLPQNSAPSQNKVNDSMLEALRKSLM